MITRIRLRRTGKKKQPHYRVVVAPAVAPRDGRFIETIGYYNPRPDPPEIQINSERALLWLRRGAQPSDTVKALLTKASVWELFRPGKPASRETEPAPPAAAEPAPQEAPEAGWGAIPEPPA